MRVLIQRVREASVSVHNKEIARINCGLLLFLGIECQDGLKDIEWLCNKIVNLRIFNDERGAMNKSVTAINGEMLLVSQFTLYASTKKGNRPSYIKAAPPEISKKLYYQFIEILEKSKLDIKVGEFGADMKVSLMNDGPVTIWIDSKSRE